MRDSPLSRLADHLPGLAFRRPLDAGEPLRAASAGASALTGYSAEELIAGAISFDDLVLPVDRERVREQLQIAADTGAPYDFRYRLATSAGLSIWVRDQGRVLREGDALYVEGYICRAPSGSLVLDSPTVYTLPLEQLLYGAPLILFALDSDARIIFSVGSALAGIEAPTDQWVGLSAMEIYEDRPERLAEIARAIAGEELTSVFEFQERWFESRYAPLRDVGGELVGTVGVSLDVTDREVAQRALESSEERFRLLAENASELIAVHDDKGRYIYVSPSYEQILGYAPEELLNRASIKMVHEEDRDRVAHAFRDILETDGAVNSTARIQHKNGHWLWIEGSARSFANSKGELRVVAVNHDITPLRDTQRALQRQLELEQKVARLSRDFLDLSLDEIDSGMQEGLILAAEIAGADRCVLGLMEARGFEVEDTFSWSRPGLDTPLPPAAATDEVEKLEFTWSSERLVKGEVVHVPDIDALPDTAAAERTDATRRGIKSFLTVPVVSAGRFTGYLYFECATEHTSWSEEEITLLRLVTEIFASIARRKRSELALRESRSQLLQAQKMDAVGRMAGGIAHDFNNLLTVISVNAEVLLRHSDAASPGHEDLQEIHAATQRAAALTKQLLSFSRRPVLQVQSVDLNAVVRGVQQILERLLGEEVRMTFDLSPTLGAVHGDSNQLEQVLVNLAVNARDAMEEGGTLGIATRDVRLSEAEAVQIGAPAAGHYVVLEVSDTGSGMSPETIEHAFEPFYTTKEPGRGTGLGLSMVYSIAHRSGGTVVIHSRLHKGTRVCFYLPRRDSAAIAASATPRDEVRGGHETILVAEDEAAVRRLLLRILETAGYEVLEARDGQEALAVADAHPGEIHLLLSDIVMPHMRGGALAKTLSEKRPGLRVLFATGYPEQEVDLSSLSGTAIQKPFTDEALLRAVREALDGPGSLLSTTSPLPES